MAKKKSLTKKPARKALRRSQGKHKSPKGKEVLPVDQVHRTRIKVIGVGGGGGNIVAEIASRVHKFDFVGANTDAQALKELPKKVKTISFGHELTNGLGCGMDPELGERAAKAEKERIKKLLEGNDICILIASLGGGTGSGATHVFAEASQELRNLCIGIFTMPFAFEGERRKQIAEAALEKIKPFVNAYMVIPNERIFQVIDQKTSLKDSLSAVNKRLTSTLEGFMDTIAMPGLVNIDFADVRSILEGRGRLAFIHSAESGGPAKAQEVVKAVLANPLCSYGIGGADRILFNIMGDRGLKMQEVAQISTAISEHNPKARIIFGISCNSRMKERIKVTLFAVGCGPGEGLKTAQIKTEKEEQKKPVAVKQARPMNTQSPAGGKKEAAVGPMGESAVRIPVRSSRVRRNALEVKKAVDQEIRELEQKEKQWDIPAFLRNK